MSKYKVNGLPWGSGIGKDVSDCVTSKDVMHKVGLDFYVDKCPLVAQMPFSINGNTHIDENNGDFSYGGKIYKDCPGAFATYRKDLDIPLGLVGDKYKVVQNIDVFNFFDDAIGEGMARWDRCGCFGYGHKIFVSAKLPFETTVGGDKIDNYLIFGNSHDGSGSVNILFAPIRCICTNMLNSAIKGADSYIRFKHTSSVKTKLNQGAEILRIACEHAKDSEQLYNSLLTIKMTDEQVMQYIASLVLNEAEHEALKNFDPKNGYSKLFARDYVTLEESGVSTRKAGILVNMLEYYMDGVGQQHIAGTAWGAYNAVTGFYSNVANLEGEKRVDSLLYGNANRNMNKALGLTLNFKEAV